MMGQPMYEILVFKTKTDGAIYFRTGNECAVYHRSKHKKLNEAYLTAIAYLKEFGEDAKEACVVLRRIDEDDL